MSINQSAFNLISQLKTVMSQLTAEQYAAPIDVLSGSSIGQHIRHTLEFFLCLQDAHIEGEINYDARKHDPYIEQDVRLAMQVAENISDHISKHVADFPLTLQANYDMDKAESFKIKTSYHRELAYNIEHAIHHMALIKVGILTSCPGVRLPDHFGVASSTVRYQKSQNA